MSIFPQNLVYIIQREYNLYSQQKERSFGIDIDKMDALTLAGIMLLDTTDYHIAGFIELIFKILWSLILRGE